MMPDENGAPSPNSPAVPRYRRAGTTRSAPFAPVLTAMPGQGIPLGDILDDSGYAHRDASAWAIPLRRPPGRSSSRTSIPHDRGPKGTHDGAVISNGMPVLPQDTAPADGTRAARPHRHERAGRSWRTQDRRAGPVQARPPHRRRHRRLPPGAVPRRHGKDPLPAPPHVDAAGPGPPRDPAAPPNIPRPAARSRRSPSRRTCSPRPRRNTTTRRWPGAAPTPAAPAPNAASPPSRTPPPPTSPAAGAASWAWSPLMLFTTALLIARNQRILAAWNARQARTTSAAPPPACRPEPVNGAARPSPCSPLRHHS